MTDGSRLSGLLLDVYGGVLAENLWTAGLDGISEAFRGSALFFGSLAADGSSAMIGHRVNPTCAALIGGPLATPAANPFIAPMINKPLGKAFQTAAMCGDRALVRSPLFEQALRPHGQRYTIGAMLERGGGTSRTVALTRGANEGDYREEEVQLLDQVLPHLARAAQLRATFGKLNGHSAGAFAVLETLDRGVVILSGNQEIAFANAEARRIFSLCDGLSATTSGLVITQRRAADQFRRVLRSANPGPICIPRPSGKLPFAISIVPAPGLLGGMPTLLQPPISLTIVDPERKSAPSQLLLREMFGLTRVEARLAATLCEFDLKQAAAQLGISVNTAKTHLQAIFQKVGVSRQSALVRLITLHAEAHPIG